MELPDGYLLSLTPAGLIAWLKSLTSTATEAAGLTAISSMFSTQELIRIGWYDNPTRELLYLLGNTGLWAARPQDTTGRTPVVESNSASQSEYQASLLRGSVTVVKTISSSSSFVRKYYAVPFALAGGAQANLSLLPAVASYFGVIRIIGIISDTTIAAFGVTFECPAGTAALPSVFTLALTEDVLNTSLQGVVITGAGTDPANDNDAIVVDLTGGGAETGFILFEGWYET